MIPSEIVLLVIVSYVDITCSAMVECVCVADSCKWKLRRQRPQRGNVNGDLAGEAQKGCALDVLAQVYKLVYLCVLCVCLRRLTWVKRVSLLVFLLFKSGEVSRACCGGAFSYDCSRACFGGAFSYNCSRQSKGVMSFLCSNMVKIHGLVSWGRFLTSVQNIQ